MAENKFKRYLWLLSTVKTFGPITFDGINYYWRRSSLNDDKEGLPSHVIGVNNKETIVNVNFGVLFPLTDGNELDYKDIKWFDECIIDESLAHENYDGFKVIENGVERIIQPTNKAYLEWRDKMLKRNQ